MEIKVTMDYDPAIRGTRIWVYGEDDRGMESVVEPLDFNMREIGVGESPPPTFTFSRRDGHAFLQSFSEALSKAGFQPDELEASNKQIDAIKYHLEDMRSMAFNKVGDR